MFFFIFNSIIVEIEHIEIYTKFQFVEISFACSPWFQYYLSYKKCEVARASFECIVGCPKLLLMYALHMQEMNLLVEADKPGNQLDDYIAKLNAILSQKAASIMQLQTRLAHFQKRLKEHNVLASSAGY